MPFIVGEDAKQVKEILSKLANKVKLVYFTQISCIYLSESIIP